MIILQENFNNGDVRQISNGDILHENNAIALQLLFTSPEHAESLWSHP